ncbi:hypothetical protein [Pseudomonas sp. Fl5BN2]|uniref:hypothetical protein n=1 Tax=Pseudomonas sp. Fl5BN2 TaxID=2697652 RepID=UPI003DA7D544
MTSDGRHQLACHTLYRVFVADECTGIGGSELALLEGEIAGCVASGQLDRAAALIHSRHHWQRFAEQLRDSLELQAEILKLARTDTLLCRCEDVP